MIEQQAFARWDDPQTSWAAARSVTDLSLKRAAVLWVLERIGPATDEQIFDEYRAHREFLPWQEPSGLRSRRSELRDDGLVVLCPEKRRLAKTGRLAQTWKVAPTS